MLVILLFYGGYAENKKIDRRNTCGPRIIPSLGTQKGIEYEENFYRAEVDCHVTEGAVNSFGKSVYTVLRGGHC